MKSKSPKTYWKVPAGQKLPIVSAPPAQSMTKAAEATPSVSRRHFLEAAGFTMSLAVVSGCGQAPEIKALPSASHPAGMVPGKMRYYASCHAGSGLLVGSRDGRPLKMEGLPEHPLSRGGLSAVDQALPLGLYDSQRLKGPLKAGKPTVWLEADIDIRNQLEEIKKSGGAVRLVTSTITSPTLKATIAQFLGQFKDGQHVTYDTLGASAILKAHEKTHGMRLLPHYQLDKARVLVSFGADFLGTWISPVEFTSAWSSLRKPTEEHPEMSYHVQLESRMSLTGSNADKRMVLAPNEQPLVLSRLAHKLAGLAGQSPGKAPTIATSVPDKEISDLAKRLWEARSESLVLCDSGSVETQVVVNFINHLLNGYGNTLDIEYPSNQQQGKDHDVLQLVEDLQKDKIAALFVAGTDLTHNLPGRESLSKAIDRVPLTVSFSEREDDFSSLAHYVCPDHHPLESWGDAEPVHGLVSICQPTIRPIGDTRSLLESLASWSGQSATQHDLVRTHWQKQIFPQQKEAEDFTTFWDKTLHNGFIQLPVKPVESGTFRIEAVKLTDRATADRALKAEGLSLVLYNKIGMPDSRHAHNAWLHELPDPITKVTWDNYVSVSTKLASAQSLTTGDVVKVTVGSASLELPVYVQPGQHEKTLAIALGYGARGTDRFSKIGPQWLESRLTVESGQTIGVNAAELISPNDDELHYVSESVSLEKTGRRHELATTQEYNSIEVPKHLAPKGGERREIVQETTLAAFAQDPKAGEPHVHHFDDVQLWAEDHPKKGNWWGMAIDLNACTGCSACVIACQSENNVPTVGKDEVLRQREMHWIRIDRYYSGDQEPDAESDIKVFHQPMMCQHCDNAPCETVCPVLATVHGDEGLNEQAYNRCVGTRYCANNCPYKVRRFNWFNYAHDDSLQNLLLNPDVTVRTRGVMEKCSMCVQRIEEGKIEARRQGQPLVDGQIQTACQQSCPAQAIVFGNMNDPDSRVSAALENPRRYRVLEEFNFRPSVAYLRVVKNVDDDLRHAPKTLSTPAFLDRERLPDKSKDRHLSLTPHPEESNHG